jgi:cytochrome c556
MLRRKSATFVIGLAASALVLWLGIAVSARAVPADSGTLDLRQPLYLTPAMAAHQKQMMREHLIAVEQIIAAVESGDYAHVAQASRTIGYSASMGQMCEMMGAATPDFTAMALKFHHTADTIAVAAARRDKDAVLAALGRTLAICTGCHATFRQEVVDETAWKRIVAKRGQQSH